jgi:beta-mannosidase
MPSMKTVDYWMGEAKDDPGHRHPQSAMNAQHCRAGLFARRFAILMNENLRMTDDLEKYVWNTQLLQSEAMGWAYQSWRRAWKSDGRRFVSLHSFFIYQAEVDRITD